MESWVSDVVFEKPGRLRRLVKAAIINPLANYLPAGLWRGLLRLTKSELAAANWADPGGWRSMVISYNGHCTQISDKILVNAGAMPMALRNRRRLGARLLARLIDQSTHQPAHVLCLGAGPGQIILDALLQSNCQAHATLVDLSADAFEYGRTLAESCGMADRMRYIQGDVRDVAKTLTERVDVVKMLGICEYLGDQQVTDIARCAATIMPAGTAMVFNSLSRAHGNDRFFRRVFGLHMTYRSPGQIRELMAAAGFGQFVTIPEPLGVYHVMVGRRL